jgi:putative flippase GtrA
LAKGLLGSIKQGKSAFVMTSSSASQPRWFSALVAWGLKTFLPFLPQRWQSFLAHISWFLVIGTLNTLVGYGLYIFFLNVVMLSVDAALIFSYLIAMMVSYLNFKFLVFRGGAQNAGLFFVPGALAVYAANYLMLHGLIDGVGLSEELAQLILLPFLAAFSYSVNRFLVFRWKR